MKTTLPPTLLLKMLGCMIMIDKLSVRGRLLSDGGRKLANQVRTAGDDVLHKKPASSAFALVIIEAARIVILELEQR
jgi:hypothetical protein